MADNDNLITTIGIGVDVKSEKALKSLDDIVRKLQSLGNVTLSKKFATNLDALAESLKKFKVSGKFDPTASLKKISSAIAQLKDAKSAIIPASVYNNIAKLGDSLKGITDADISRLERLADALLKMKDLSGFKFPSMGAVRKATSASQDKQLPAIFGGRQMPSLYEGTTQSGFKDIEKDSNIIEGTFKEIPRDLTASLLPASALEDLALRIYNNFGKIGDAVSKAKSELMAIGNAVKVTSVAIGKFAGGMMLAPWRAIGSTIGNATKRLFGFLSALKRIAIYRAIRTALKEITQGFKEGMQNLYQYSVLIDGKFKESMDSLATSALYAKNSLGAMSAPIVNVLAPAVDMLVDKFVDLINTINELFATLTGATTWTRALKYPKEYMEAMDGASGSAKALRATLLGFDEINRLDDNNRGSRGRASDELDYSKMFEEVAVSKFAQNWADKVRNAFATADFSGIGDDIGNALKRALGNINWASIKKKGNDVAMSLATLINGFVDVPALGHTIGSNIAEAINTGVGTIYTFYDTVEWQHIGNFIGDGVNGFTKTFDANRLGASFAKTLNAGIDTLYGFMSTVKWDDVGRFISNGINGFFNTVNTKKLGQMISKGILGAIEMVDTFFKETDFKKIGYSIGQFLKEIKWKEILGGLAVLLYDGFKAMLSTVGGLIESDPQFATAIGLIIGAKIALAIGGSAVSAMITSALQSQIANSANNVVVNTGNGNGGGGGTGSGLGGLFGNLFGVYAIKKGVDKVKDIINFDKESLIPWQPHTGDRTDWNKLLNSISSNAGGGSVATGDLFLANEKEPELIAHLGNRTQVANNDQITESIRVATAQGNAESNMLLREVVSICQALLNKETMVVAEVTTDSITSGLARQNRRNGRTVVPVGG